MPRSTVERAPADAFEAMLADAESALAGSEDDRDWACDVPVFCLAEDARSGVPAHLVERYAAVVAAAQAHQEQKRQTGSDLAALIRSGVVCPTCADEGETACSCGDGVA